MTVYRRNCRRILIRNGSVVAMLGAWGLVLGGGPLLSILAAVVVAFTIWVVRRPRLSVNERGLMVANMFTTRRIPWEQVRGFGYGVHGRAWCVQVERAAGKVASVEVLSDNVTAGGYSREQTSEIVARLRATFEEKTGIHDSSRMIDLGHGRAVDADSLGGSDLAVSRAKRQLRWGMWTWIVFGVVLVGVGASMVANAAERPHVYAQLRRDGVALSAVFDGCGPVDRFDHKDIVCRLSLDYLGRTRRWDYSDDYRQFDHLIVGDPVPVLLDPSHPATVYTVHDVAINDNSGVLSIFGLFGIGMIALGLASLAFIFRIRRDARQRWRARTAPEIVDLKHARSGEKTA